MNIHVSPDESNERAPLLVFGPLPDRMVGILAGRSGLASRMVYAPPEAVHATAAFLYLAPQAGGTDAEVGDLIEQTDPRNLLKLALPDCPARLYRALYRAGGSVRDRSYYVRLNAVCCEPFGSAVLDGDLNDSRAEECGSIVRAATVAGTEAEGGRDQAGRGHPRATRSPISTAPHASRRSTRTSMMTMTWMTCWTMLVTNMALANMKEVTQ